jgi:hypothetical protein
VIIFDVLLLTTVVFIAASLVISTLKLGISPMPSSSKAYNTMLKLVDETGSGAVIDLGSGWGHFVIRIAKKSPQRPVIGYELSLFPWLTSIILKKVLGLKNLTLYRKNFYHEKLPDASVLVCYLYPEAMSKIKHKLLLEKPKVDFLISNNFAVSSWQVNKVIHLDDFYKSPIYLYQIPNGNINAQAS